MARDESCKERGRGRHPVFFTDLPRITELGETENTSTIIGSCGRSQRVVNCKEGVVDKWFGEGGFKVGSLS